MDLGRMRAMTKTARECGRSSWRRLTTTSHREERVRTLADEDEWERAEASDPPDA